VCIDFVKLICFQMLAVVVRLLLAPSSIRFVIPLGEGAQSKQGQTSPLNTSIILEREIDINTSRKGNREMTALSH